MMGEDFSESVGDHFSESGDDNISEWMGGFPRNQQAGVRHRFKGGSELPYRLRRNFSAARLLLKYHLLRI
jgi:hypothetical protein